MNISFKIRFHSEWHCGSGLAAGADLDALVIKNNGLPFVPGKTIKGLVREAVAEILILRGVTDEKQKLFIETFGNSEDKNELGICDNDLVRKGSAFFENAELEENIRYTIQKDNLEKYLYRSISSTAIDDDGIAVKHSLRRLETVVPCELCGRILEIPDAFANDMIDGLRYIKRLGLNRNRGLGRCDFYIKEEDK